MEIREQMWGRKLMTWGRIAAAILFWPAMAVVLWGELNPSPSSLEQHFWDKGLHFSAYFGLAGIASWALRGSRNVVWAVIGLIALGGSLEIVQGMIGRDMSIYDELANSLGAVTGALLGWAVWSIVKKRAGVSGDC